MHLVNKRRSFLFVPLLLFLAFLVLLVSLCRPNHGMGSKRAILLVEKYLDITVPLDSKRMFTCYSYDASKCLWGTFLLLEEKDANVFFDKGRWKLYQYKIEKNIFPPSIDIRDVLYSKQIKWWDPDIHNSEAMYINQSTRYQMKMLIEKQVKGSVKVFIVMEGNKNDIPLEVERFFEMSCSVKVL